ncbi:MAG TPA: FAD-dependent monooxygenase [Myxococcales bacterium]|nr:FAD-dependent monooxygenase [Myxococcales bacterium]
MTSLPTRTDVVIVGAGPTGLALAATLAKSGVDLVLLDRLAEGANTSRAAVVHARTLEVLETLEVSDRLRAEGLVVPKFTIRDRDRELLTIRFDRLPTRYPYTLMIPQDRTEAILLGRLRELGGQVHRPWTVTDVRQDDSGAEVTVSGNGDAPQTIRARYVVGTDGMHSTVRERAGIPFVGGSYEESFLLADVRMRWALDRDEVMLFFSPEGVMVIAPLPGEHHRIVATVDEAPENPSLADVQRLLDSRGPASGGARIDQLVWSSRFRVHHRVAGTYRAGRVLLAGDAAHVHSPAGGQGMNTGIQDAVALGETLAAVVAGRSGESTLDEYERTRRPIAERVVALADRLTRVATVQGRGAQSLRNAALRTLDHVPVFRRRLAMQLAELR